MPRRFTAKDRRHMERALELAAKAYGRTSPNPLVGAVVVRDGEVVGEGYHRRAGEPHAEVEALRDAGGEAKGATLYTNLEPCSHTGRTPPCVDTIVRAEIKRVVAAMEDPNPKVNGGGLDALRGAGIKAEAGLLKKKARKLNGPYIKFITQGLPCTTVKMAVSLDGKIATATGESRWVTGVEARRMVHHFRNYADAVMIGIGTVLADDPRLNVRVRFPDVRHPQKVIVDSKARMPTRGRTITEDPRTIVAVSPKASLSRITSLEDVGARVEVIQGSPVRVDMTRLMRRLAELDIVSVLVEGGGGVAGSLFEAGLVDEVVVFVAPVIIGGKDAPGPVGGRGIEHMIDAHRLVDVTHEQVGDDLMIRGRVRRGYTTNGDVTLSE
ncbi:bifunctional diaminohydroxyphosphoribosylaminopyrimidine deaminase/5-amino-6-(5-phosphoribosylamino)uracil reductase RibD [bacterium]|nr:bifunctional diaminohydroxyphosphoribosylaminopyrimidine deaminase/5-amino-6-(5-phosphoribosylamino)uracil reductase RibD [bacterium]